MKKQKVHTRKGEMTRKKYKTSLSEVFFSYKNKVFEVDTCLSLLNDQGIRKVTDSKSLYKILFGYQNLKNCKETRGLPYTFAGPFQMETVLNTRFLFNLEYQDNVIKIELEKATNELEEFADYHTTLKKILRATSIILRTAFFSHEPLYLKLTNAELDSIILKCLSLFDIMHVSKSSSASLIEVGCKANEISGCVQNHISSNKSITLDNILPFLIFSGVIWWSKQEIQRDFYSNPKNFIPKLAYRLSQLTLNDIAINDYYLFQSEVIKSKTPKKLLYFLDDNGELVWHLLFIALILKANSRLHITCVANQKPITNNATTGMILEYLKNPYCNLDLLGNDRFCILSEPNELTAIDLRFITSRLREKIESADYILVNGVSFFEKIQYLPVPTYYMFVVHSNTSMLLTGLKKHKGVFVRIGPNLCSFSHIEDDGTDLKIGMNLQEIHKISHTQSYKQLLEHFESETELNIWLRMKANRHKITIAEMFRRITDSYNHIGSPE